METASKQEPGDFWLDRGRAGGAGGEQEESRGRAGGAGGQQEAQGESRRAPTPSPSIFLSLSLSAAVLLIVSVFI